MQSRTFPLSRVIIIGLVVYALVYFLGAYQYTLYSIEGVLYFVLSFFCLYIGVWFVERLAPRTRTCVKFELGRRAEVATLLVLVAGLVAFLLYMYFVNTRVDLRTEFATGDYRGVISTNRPLYSKIAEVLMNLCRIGFLIVAGCSSVHFRLTRPLANLAILLPAFALLAIGARGQAVVSTFIFFAATILRYKRFGLRPRINSRTMFSASGISILAYYVFTLFNYRGVRVPLGEAYLLVPGDMQLRAIYRFLASNAALEPLTRPLIGASSYYAHSLSFFSWLFTASDYSTPFWGVLHFRLFGFISSLIGLQFPAYMDIIRSQAFYGYYPTFVQGYLLDWGPWLAPVAIFFTGILLGLLQKSSRRGGFGYFIEPLLLTMCFIAPIYYFWHIADIDTTLFLYMFIYPILSLLGFTRSFDDGKKIGNKEVN